MNLAEKNEVSQSLAVVQVEKIRSIAGRVTDFKLPSRKFD